MNRKQRSLLLAAIFAMLLTITQLNTLYSNLKSMNRLIIQLKTDTPAQTTMEVFYARKGSVFEGHNAIREYIWLDSQYREVILELDGIDFLHAIDGTRIDFGEDAKTYFVKDITFQNSENRRITLDANEIIEKFQGIHQAEMTLMNDGSLRLEALGEDAYIFGDDFLDMYTALFQNIPMNVLIFKSAVVFFVLRFLISIPIIYVLDKYLINRV